MLSNEAFFTVLLASRLAIATYIPLPPQPIERDADEIQHHQPEKLVTEVRVVTERHAVDSPPKFTFDPSVSYTYDPLPSYTYDPLPTYTYNPPSKRTDEGVDLAVLGEPSNDRNLPTFSFQPPNPNAIPSSFKTTPLTQLEITPILDPNGPPPPNLSAIPSAFKTTPLSRISITSLLDPNGPPPPNPTAVPSSFKTTPFSKLEITSLLDPNGPPPPNPTASPSAFRTRPLSSISITSLLDPDSPPPPNITASPSASKTKPLSRISITSLLDPNGPPPPNPTATPPMFKTKPLSNLKITSLLDPNSPPPPRTTPITTTLGAQDIVAALMRMTSVGHQNQLPSLVPIQIDSSVTEVPIISSVPGAIGPRPLTPTIVNGGTAWVPQYVTRTNLNSGKNTASTKTTAFQFVSPGALLTHSPISEMIAWSLTGKGGTEGGWSVYTTTLPTGMATNTEEVQSRKGNGIQNSLLGFVSVGGSGSGKGSVSKTSGPVLTMANSMDNWPTRPHAMTSRTTETGSSETARTGKVSATKSQHQQKPVASASSLTKSGSTDTCTSTTDTCTSTTSMRPSKTSKALASSSVAEAKMTPSSTKTTPIKPSTTTERESPSPAPAQMIGKGNGRKQKGDPRCIYPYPHCDL